MVRNRRCYFFPFVWPVRVSAIRFYAWIFFLLESAHVDPGSLHVSPRGVCKCRYLRSSISCYERQHFAVIETAFCRHRDAVSLKLIRRFAKMPPPIEVLRLNFRTTDMTAKRGKSIKKATFYMLFEVF